MDRTSFFPTCSFLLPLRSTAWPPNSACKTFIGGGRCCFVLSVEIQDNSSSPRPIFFGGKDQDSTLTPIELCYDGEEGTLYSRIGSDVFLVDSQQIQSASVTKTVLQDGTGETNRAVAAPPFLKISFLGLYFRIFGNRQIPAVCEEDYEKLQEASKVVSKAKGTRFSVNYEDISSPCRVSVSSTEPNDSSSTELLPDTKRKRDDGRDHLKRLEKRRGNYVDYLSSLDSLKHVLQQPVSEPTDPSCLTPLLNRIGDSAVASYAMSEEVHAATTHYDHQIKEQQTQVEKILDDFFPAKRRRSVDGVTPKKQPGQVKVCVDKIQEVIWKQEDASEAKYEMLLLPRRG